MKYEPLSGQDRTFLPYETATSHMHITWTLVFDRPARGTKPIDLAAFRRLIAERLDRVPRLRQRLHFAPITGEPSWVDDDRFDLAAHASAVRLRAPGDDAALKATTAWLMERQLPRFRPLWEAWLVEGLAGRRAAVVLKIHHAMADGVSTVDVLTALFGESSRVDRDPTSGPGSIPPAPLSARLAATLATMRAGITPAPTTPLNRPIGPHRRVEWTSVELDDVRAIRRRLGGTLNDVVLATVAGAVRRFLARTGDGRAAAADGFRVVVPVSVRRPEERGALGNRASAWIVPLPLAEPDPARRLARVSERTATFKESRQALGGELMNELAGIAGSMMTTIGIRVLTELVRPYNLIVTNIPGPTIPLALGSAPVVETYPQVPLFPNQALGIALSSDRRRLFWGFSADPDALDDLSGFRDDLLESFADLLNAARPAAVARGNHHDAGRLRAASEPVFQLDNQTFV